MSGKPERPRSAAGPLSRALNSVRRAIGGGASVYLPRWTTRAQLMSRIVVARNMFSSASRGARRSVPARALRLCCGR